MTLRSLALFLGIGVAFAATKKVEEAPSGNPIVEHLQALFQDVLHATLGAGEDVLGYILASPRFLVDFYVQMLAYARSVPGMVKNVYAGDAATMCRGGGSAWSHVAPPSTDFIIVTELHNPIQFDSL